MRVCKFLSFSFLLAAILLGCSGGENKDGGMAGHWLIVYPDHKLTSYDQQEVYGRYQDSIVNLYGLKLIQLKENGDFLETDSLFKKPAKWSLNKEQFLIQEGGKGFNPFRTTADGNVKSMLRLTQSLNLEDEKIKIVWNLKKLDEGPLVDSLFSEKSNSWRKKPAASETEALLKKRLAAMLMYYSSYFNLVAKEAIYFSPVRVLLPLQYYQHAIGLKEMTPKFASLFFDELNAAQAHQLLGLAIEGIDGASASRDNYVVEYAGFLREMSAWLSR